MVFGVGWGLLQRLTDPTTNFFPVSTAHPVLNVAFRVLQAAGLVGFVTFLAGGLPIFVIASNRAFSHRQQSTIISLWIAVLSLAEFTLDELRRMRIPERVILAGMGAALSASVVLVITISTTAPQLWTLQDVSSRMFATGMVLMAVGILLAYIGLRQGRATGDAGQA